MVLGNGVDTDSERPWTTETTAAGFEDSDEPPTTAEPQSPASGDGDGGSQDSPDPGEGARRASSKVANLRAAFERSDSSDSQTIPMTKRPLERSPLGYRDREAEVARLKEEHEAERAILRKRLEEDTAEVRTQLAKREEECDELRQEVDKLRAQLAKQDGEWQIKMEGSNSALEQERIQAQEDVINAQRQLMELKRSISTATRMENQVSDTTLAERFGTLQHELQNWIVTSFRRLKTDSTASEMCARLDKIAEPVKLETLHPIFEKFEPRFYIAALQSTAATYLLEIFDSLLFGLPSQSDWRRHIQKAVETLPAVLPATTFNKWRSHTLDVIRRSDNISESLESASAGMAEMICITLSTLTEAEESQSRISSLTPIIRRAVSLSHLFRVQRAQYEFSLPPPGTSFQPELMEETSDDGDVSARRFIRCATFPSLIKRGDESGDNPELLNVIVRAKVLCD